MCIYHQIKTTRGISVPRDHKNNRKLFTMSGITVSMYMSQEENLPNVFLLSADSLRYDYFSEAQEELADLTNGVSYTNAVAPATQTSSSMPVLATGQYTDEIDTWGLPESGGPQPLAEIFRDLGYTTALWSDNFLFGAEYNYDRGFDGGDIGSPTWKKRMSMGLRNGPTEHIFPIVEWIYFQVFKRLTGSVGGEENFYRPASNLNQASLEWLSDQDFPTFAWIHYMDTHHPYEPPSSYLEKRDFNTPRNRGEISQLTRNVIKSNGEGYSISDIEDVKCAYEAACEYQADETISFVKQAKELNLYDPDQDIFVFTADHGECLSYEDYEMMGHVPPALWEEIIRVPLVISLPEWSQETIDEQTSLANLYKTIKSAVSSQTQKSGKQQCPSPEQLVESTAHFVTEWGVPSDGTVHTYRGIRTDKYEKLFGGHINGDDRVVFSRYDSDGLADDVEMASDYYTFKTNKKNDTRYKELVDRIEERGPIIEGDHTLKGEVNEEHLQDLGYL